MYQIVGMIVPVLMTLEDIIVTEIVTTGSAILDESDGQMVEDEALVNMNDEPHSDAELEPT